MAQETDRQLWDNAAARFDDEPDHGLRDAAVRAAWLARLAKWLPSAPAAVLDLGCGTGSLSVLIAELGHRVTGIDFSPKMIAQAKAKASAAGQDIPFEVMDAAAPTLPHDTFDAVVCRHVLWMMPMPAEVLQRWSKLLRPKGRLVLIEGFWHTGAGLHASQVIDALPANFKTVSVDPLSEESVLWGGRVSDERFAVVASKEPRALQGP